jgi:hypothetical protein
MSALRCTVPLLFASISFACHAPAPETADGSKDGGDASPVATSKLQQSGCSIELEGSWNLLGESAEGDGSWSAARVDGDETLTVLPMPWKAPKLEKEWREDLGAVMELRRNAEADRDGTANISEPEYVGDGQNPGAFYTTHSLAEGQGTVTIAKASPTLLCVFFLAGPATGPAVLAERARTALPKARAAETP